MGRHRTYVGHCLCIRNVYRLDWNRYDFVAHLFTFTSDYEFNLLWAMTVLAVLLQTSFLTLPFGFALFYLKGVVPPEVTMTDIYRGMVPFIVIMLIVTALVIVIPDLIMVAKLIEFVVT